MPVQRTIDFLSQLPRSFRGRSRSERGRSAHAQAAVTPLPVTSHQHFDHQRSRAVRNTLADLSRGDTAVIASIAGTTSARLHLMEMGLTPGTSVRVVRVAVFGGPLDITVRGYRLSLRREEARAIMLK